MKIYGSTFTIDDQIQILEDCKTRGLWVRCDNLLIKNFGWSGSDVLYILPEIIESDYHSHSDNRLVPRVRGRYAYADDFELPVYGFTSDTQWFYLGENEGFCISNPVATYTTEELFGIDAESTQAMFKRFQGKPYWILATGPYIGYTYIKVLEITPKYLYADTISDEYVHYERDSFSEYPPSEMSETQTISWDNIQLYQPINILSEDEMNEMLAESDSLYEEGPYGE